MAIVFKPTELVIFITAPQTSVEIQDLVNAIRDWEDSPEGIVWPEICNASGKNPIPGGYVGITLELINNWRIQFEARPGPDWVRCEVRGGNLTATNDYGNNPIKDSPYVNVMIAQSTSPALVYASGGSPEEIADAVWNEEATGHTEPGKAGAQLWTKINAVKDKTDNLPSDPASQASLDRVLGLSRENQYIDQATYDSYGNMTSCRVRIYDDPSKVGTDTGVIATYLMTATYSGPNLMTTFKVVRV